ncbi:MAG: putative aminopeptidase YsdC [Candidatus Heimdallarchaeota archaeon LC_3]|nr:MAG: putative aminopeptidase YsdC [Candidatus Heimdallarchaeota archaeon LC_3]
MNNKEFLDVQKAFSELLGLPGYEDEVSSFILKKISPFVDKAWKDPLGNILAIKEGTDKDAGQRILLDAHMDEVGFMISHIESSGFLRFTPLGGFDNRIFLASSIKIQNSRGEHFHGVIGVKPPHLLKEEEKNLPISVSDLYIDIGMFSKQEVLDFGIDIGSVGTLYDPFLELPNGMIRGKALDDRVGCNIMIQIAKILYEHGPLKDSVLYSFSVQEEVGLRGARTAAYSLDPTIALAIETTTAGDTPNIPENESPVSVNKGPSITLADNTIISNPKVNNRLVKNAQIENVLFQYKKPKFGGNNAGVIHLTKQGIPTSVVSVPCRYLHTSVSMLKISDIQEAIKLIDVFIRNPAEV